MVCLETELHLNGKWTVVRSIGLQYVQYGLYPDNRNPNPLNVTRETHPVPMGPSLIRYLIQFNVYYAKITVG